MGGACYSTKKYGFHNHRATLQIPTSQQTTFLFCNLIAVTKTQLLFCALLARQLTKMKLIDTPSARLVERLNRCGLGGYLRVSLTTPWANLEEALA
jgi:hypothetical protein